MAISFITNPSNLSIRSKNKFFEKNRRDIQQRRISPRRCRISGLAMAAVRFLRPSHLFFIFLVLSPPTLSISDSEALLKLKKSFTNAKALDSWAPGSAPCTGKIQWVGIICFNGIVTGLRLGQMGLSGKIDINALLEIPGLRSVSFVNNSFSGPIPKFNRLGALKGIYLSGNQFTGKIPSDYFANMESLKKLWLAGNRFTGEIPGSLAQLHHLIELHLENNQFSGIIPPIGHQKLVSFNVSNNKLKGEIPPTLFMMNSSSFKNNAGLCGKQVGKECAIVMEASPVSDGNKEKKPNNVAAAFVTLVVVILMLMGGAIVVKRRREKEFDINWGANLDLDEVHVSGSNRSNRKSVESSRKGMDSGRKGSSQNSKGTAGMDDLVVVNDEKGVFGLPDLMKAAAEVLGNGSLGSAYKAVMSSGVAVVVKRMRDMNRMDRDSFDAEVTRLGKLRHRNILPPLAYHYRKDEKLLIYEYIPKGSLLYLLHGDRGPCHAELDWPARLKIVRGIAHGIDFLHEEFASCDLPHGNLKSSNVLLGSNHEPLLIDYGFCPLVYPTQAAQAMFAYKSPESIQNRHVSPKSDVYCFGIIILEILTGKFPSQYLNNGKGGTDVVQWVLTAILDKREAELFDPEIAGSRNSLNEMQRLLHIGAACTESDPEERLDMKEAIRMIEEIQIEGFQEARPIQFAPSLRDGYGELSESQSHELNVREGYGELSSRRTGLASFEDRSGRGNGDSFAFAIS
ncbi:hypothetical protein HHK36_021897 [Tetracentron sinense]|uniref:Protein kinase domain-containing protein n=1 Tax=Tetracentron sinense TaxID=13715 RepID=A0A834YXW9_TETSI|nr:hypothetical protein HHK36_021897 [Tetracentron sinense]